MPKHELRHQMLLRRSALAPPELKELGLSAQQRCLALPAFAAARVVALYAPIRNEVETALLVTESLATGKTVLLPAVTAGGLEFRRLDDPALLVCGRFGICEPPEGSLAYPPSAVEFFLVPGVAFDQAGRRIGYGKGFYDRALHQLEGSGRLAGFCYDFQLVESIAGAPHDVQMDLVVTDRRVVTLAVT